MYFCLFVCFFGEPELRNCFSLLFNRIIIYLAGSSVSSTMLSKDALKNSNLVLSPLNFGSKNFFRFLFTRLNGNSFVFFGFGAFRLQIAFGQSRADRRIFLCTRGQKVFDYRDFFVCVLRDFIYLLLGVCQILLVAILLICNG